MTKEEFKDLQLALQESVSIHRMMHCFAFRELRGRLFDLACESAFRFDRCSYKFIKHAIQSKLYDNTSSDQRDTNDNKFKTEKKPCSANQNFIHSSLE